MSDIIEAARSGRAKCRGCSEKIAKLELRFGEEVPNPFADEEDATTTHWFHVTCASEKRAEKFAAALDESEMDVPDREALRQIAQDGIDNPNLCQVLRGERAPSGRARCRQCKELIEKSALRVAIEPEDDPMGIAPAFFVHAGCAVEKLCAGVGQETGLATKLERVSTALTPEDMIELRGLLQAD